jgi:hypothetical protein
MSHHPVFSEEGAELLECVGIANQAETFYSPGRARAARVRAKISKDSTEIFATLRRQDRGLNRAAVAALAG